MIKGTITFDRFVRGIISLLCIGGVLLLLKYLGPVLIPFFVAWLIAYLLYPIVTFLQQRCRLKNRWLSIVLTLLLVGGSIGGLLYVSVPPMVKECIHLKNVAISYIEHGANNSSIPEAVQQLVQEHANDLQLSKVLRNENVIKAAKSILPTVWETLWSTAGFIINFVASLIGLLYLLFLLKDYEKYAEGWIHLVPTHKRHFVSTLASDIERGMNGYFRGQALIALSNCVMFTIGFYLIDFPMALGLGLFIGLISFVPYLQVVGFIPAIVLALLRAAETGDNFWWLIGGVLLVYLVVQIIQDAIVTPQIMGKIMNLSPAIILLSLSVWGYLFGIIGLIIALPMTTLCISYYKRYIIGAQHTPEAANDSPDKAPKA